jgi:uncharacterized membrane protein
MTKNIHPILPYVFVLIAYILGEATWLTWMFPLYKKWFSPYNRTLEIFSKVAVVATYFVLLVAFAVLVLSQLSQMNSKSLMTDAFLKGAVFGLVVYGIYNGTNVATLPGYSWTMVLIDTSWGTIWFGLLALFFAILVKQK